MAHKTVDISLNTNYTVAIDEKIADLVVALNQLGLITHMSCQDNVEKRAWVSFYRQRDAQDFLALVAEKSPKLRHLIQNATTQDYDHIPNRHKVKDRWWVDCYVHHTEHPTPSSPSHIAVMIRISVRFPKKFLKEVTEIVEAERNELF